MVGPYFLFVNSRPIPESGTDDALWEKWYVTEHLPDLISSGTATRGTFYRETYDFPGAPKEKNPRNFLAVYHTEFEESLETKNFKEKTRPGSDLFPNKFHILENGDFDVRNYKLLVDYDPKKIGEVPPPFMVTVEMETDDEEGLNKWYEEEHLELLSKLPGYRRSARYTLGPVSVLSTTKASKYLAIHELDNLKGLGSKEAETANTTPQSIKHITTSKVFIARAWELVHSEGF
ncbi:hypothetical protein PV10_02299 [Exophiala mesophila]|uniref:EthD domain-containing protein n=1 Tax=Exophiala mesophila TaxID=212818 RepID=A0A0D2A6G5_EXOME|nr:uncharacterized protein PV10_02299 [Exophiala mesophila]KIV94543.1 hypothetical protein PV10_02299 [Exophiala mesophila]